MRSRPARAMLANNGFTSLLFVLAATGTRNVTYYSLARPRLFHQLVVTRWRCDSFVLGTTSSRRRLLPIFHHRGVWPTQRSNNTSDISWVRTFISPGPLTSVAREIGASYALPLLRFTAKMLGGFSFLYLCCVDLGMPRETAAGVSCYRREQSDIVRSHGDDRRPRASHSVAYRIGCLCLARASSGTSSGGRSHTQKIRSWIPRMQFPVSARIS